jgi:hypothetical protein
MTHDINTRVEMNRRFDHGEKRDYVGNRKEWLTDEQDTLRLMYNDLDQAISGCRRIASHPYHGPAFTDLMNNIMTVDRCCRRMNGIRLDTRWLNGLDALNQVKVKAQSWLCPASVESKKMFRLLADFLKAFKRGLEKLALTKPPTMGAILPVTIQESRTQGRSILMPEAAPSFVPGLLLPPGFAKHG